MIGQVISHYRILEKLGEGGMGVVYIAEDTLLGRRVAVKTLTAVNAPGKQHFRTRFLREARAISMLNHPHIAAIHDYGETQDGQPFIVMELVKGATLSDLLSEDALTLARAIEIIKEIAEALAEAHRHGIIHRDIKPSNVAINERGEVKVLDFGLAKQVNDGQIQTADSELQTLLNTQTREGVVVGTPMYLSPEQAMGVPVDSRSDLFSLGSLLYECISGRPAFSGLSAVEICAQVIRDDPPKPSQFNPRVPPELDRIALRLLAKKVNDRYQSAEELIADLNAAQTSLLKEDSGQAARQRVTQVLNVGRTSALSTLSDIFKRPRLSVGYFFIALLVAGGIAAVLWYMSRPSPHQPKAEAQRLFELGANALREGSYYKASKILERAVEVDDKFALAHARLAEAWIELDYTDKAKDELLIVTNKLVPDRSILPQLDALYLDAVTATVTHDLDRAVKSYAEIVSLKPNDAQAQVDLGRAYEKSDAVNKAIESYAKAAQLDPNNAAAFLRLGVLYSRKQDAPGSKATFDKAEALYQDSSNFEGVAEVFYHRGYFHNQAGRLREAREQLQKALDITRINNNRYQQIKVLLELGRIAYSEGDTAQARQYATDAVELAKANGMENLTTQGLHDLGYAFFVRRAYDDAEQYFKQALDFAQRFKGRNNEARVMLSLGSLHIYRDEPDKGLTYIEQALAYYRNGGYRKEVSKCLTRLGRANLLKGDYDAALKIFDEQLQLARQVDDPEQVVQSQNEIGLALARHELYPEALRRYNESYAISETLGNPKNAGFSLLNRADMLAKLGRYEEARAALDRLPSLAERLDSENTYKQLWAIWIHLIKARMALSERQFDKAIAECQQAIALATAPQFAPTAAETKATLGLAQTLSGAKAAGKKSCAEALALAKNIGDKLLLSNVLLAFAEVALENGDWQDAAVNASEAQKIFASTGRQESEWRAWLIIMRASERMNDHLVAHAQAVRARELISELQRHWDTESFSTYAARQDIRLYREQLEKALAESN